MAGTVTLSIEVELGWGMHEKGIFSHLSSDRSAEDLALKRILDKCEDHQLPISFDIVGHLYYNTCHGSHEGPYPDTWWKNDPGSSYEEDPLFYAPDMVNSILDRPTDHELCTHTYSHILAEEASDELIRHELRLVQDVHQRYDLPAPSSIVMPRHHNVDYSILKEFGIDVIRRPIQDYGSEMSPIKKLWWLYTRSHPKCEVKTRDGLVETTCTTHPSLAGFMLPSGQKNPSNLFRGIPQQVREKMHQRYLTDAIELAARTDEHIHLWTHLYNIANDSQWRAIEPALNRLAHLREKGDIEIIRMCDIPEKLV